MAFIDTWNLYHSDNIRGRTFAAIAKAARDILNEALPTSNLASNANSGQATAVLVTSGGYNFKVGKVCTISDTGHSEDVTILSIAGDTLTFTSNLVNSYTTANSAKVTFKTDIERITWAQSVRVNMADWADIMMWDVMNNSNVQSLGEACADSDIQNAVNGSINDYAFNI